MTLNEYQQKALETAVYPQEYKVIYPALGLTGEAGECSDKVKKVIRDNNGEFTIEKKVEIAKEYGIALQQSFDVLAHIVGVWLVGFGTNVEWSDYVWAVPSFIQAKLIP